MTTAVEWRLPARPIFLVLLLVTALDSAALGLWAVARPDDLFAILGTAPPRDVMLWRILGVLAVAHALILCMLVVWPETFGPLVLVPLFGRALSLGAWLFFLGTDRVRLAPTPLAVLAVHDALGLLVLAVFLVAWYRTCPRP